MNKQWYRALSAFAHPTLLGVVNSDEETSAVSLDIRLVDYNGEGIQSDAQDTRFIRVCEGNAQDVIHPLCLKQGEAYLRLEDVCAPVTIFQCDENGRRIKGPFAVSYEWNQERIQGDEVSMDDVRGNQCIDIHNVKDRELTLRIVKKLVNQHEETQPLCEDQNFLIHVEGCGIHESVCLNHDNDFCAQLRLNSGVYQVWEENSDSFSLCLDGTPISRETALLLKQAEHTLEVINHTHTGNTLCLDQYVRCANGELIKPQEQERFVVSVRGAGFEACYTLDQGNDFAYCIEDLADGCYEVLAQNCDGITHYLVNAQAQSDEARVELYGCARASVLILCEQEVCVQESPLRICKYIRRGDQTLVKPDPGESFRVMLRGCGICEIFNLNAYNNFCVDIEHICIGEYEICELDHEGYVASYIVDDGCESTAAQLWMNQGTNHCVTIINEERNKGEITLSKVIRQGDGTLVKPEKNARFLVTLRSIFARETYVLDQSNDFCAHIHHLKEGSYEVKEHRIPGYATTYRINGGKEEHKARFVVMNHTCSDVKIINSAICETIGDLRICKFIANAYGDYVKPQSDEEFQIHVEGPCLDQCYTLRAANSWSILLEGLKKGVYRILEEGAYGYQTQYFVNGDAMEEAALVCMDHQNQDVVIVNTRQSSGTIKLNVVTQDCEGQCHKPAVTQFFDVVIETWEGSRCVRLDAHNRFGLLLDDLPRGKVVIMQKDSYGYRVLYEVNGECKNHASLIMEGEAASVTIVNQVMNCSGVVRIRKQIKTLHGRIIRPCDQDRYAFTLRSRCVHEEFTLSRHNQFCVLFDDLEEGDYKLEECAVPGMETSYRINGEVCEDAHFHLGREDVDIEVLNTVLPLPKLCVHKRVLKNGIQCKPQGHEQFHFQLIGRDKHETYCLNQENDWCVEIENLYPQHYEIRELHAQNCVMYEIDGQIQESGTLMIKDHDVKAVIINPAPSESIVRITKRLRDINGQLCRPCAQECYEAVLESDCYKQCFTLDARNDWCVEIEGLPQGKYRVSQLGEECFEVWINGSNCMDQTFYLGDQDVAVTLISPLGCENELILRAYRLCNEQTRMPSADRIYHVSVTHEGVCDEFTLDASNHFAISLANIQLGEYRISARETMLYEACGEWFEQAIDVEMGCGELCVNLYEEDRQCFDITIHKLSNRSSNGDCGCQMDTQILLCGPKGEECFTLGAHNDWTLHLCDYPIGSYELTDMSNDAVCYKIQGKLSRYGRFVLCDQPVSITIVPKEEESECPSTSSCNTKPCDEEICGGTLHVHALIQNAQKELESAPRSAAFALRIDGDQVCEDITLNERNGFLMDFAYLPKGSLHITAMPAASYSAVAYRVNGVIQKAGDIMLDKEDIQVDVLYAQTEKSGSIHVMKYLRDESCGCFKRPCMDEEYEICIRSENEQRKAILNRDNKWSVLFDELEAGDYRIEETGCANVNCIVNGGKEQRNPMINVSDRQINVKLIHEAKPQASGSLEICKYVLDEQGNQMTPSGQNSCWIAVKGEQETHRILLHEANHFYAQLPHLPGGSYEVIQEDSEETLRFRCNGKEIKDGHIVIGDALCSVDIIASSCHTGSITLTKRIQDENGLVQMPKHGSYRIHVSSHGYNQIVTLDAQNRYCAVLNDLSNGLYVVDELDEEGVLYRVDHGYLVDRAIVKVTGAHEVSIINPTQTCACGSIRFDQYIRNSAGLLVRPSAPSTFTYHISTPHEHKEIVLNEANHWSTQLDHLMNGNYVIHEIGTQAVSYIINDRSECDYGIVDVKGNANFVAIIHQEQATDAGQITITKYVRNGSRIERVHEGGAISVHVSAPGYQNEVILNQANHWQATLGNLKAAHYVLEEVNHEGSNAWRIDGGYEVDHAIVNVAGDAHQVDMINEAQTSTSSNILHIEKRMRLAGGALCKPEGTQRFTFLLQGAKTTNVVLSQENDWTMHLEGLENGSYTLKELDDHYDVSYEINGVSHQKEVPFVLNGGRVDIQIINAQRMMPSYALDLFKYMKKDNGGLMRPADGDSFELELIGPNTKQRILLDDQNQFHQRITDLTMGTYTIQECDNDAYSTNFCINGKLSTKGEIVINGQRHDVVEVINELNVNRNVVDIFKYVNDAQGEIVKPSGDASYRFLLTGNHMHQLYTLDRSNDWHLQLDTLDNGEYEIMEQKRGNERTLYRVNGGPLSATGEFVVSGGSQNFIEIINQSEAAANGVITLEKRIRDENGDVRTPGNGESFLVSLSSEENGYDVIYTLDSYNGYTLQVDGLKRGRYQVRESDTTGYGVTYVVDGAKESSDAFVEVAASEHSVCIINTKTELFFHVEQDNGLHVVIE